MRSFQIIEDKIAETDFFLEKIEETTFGHEAFIGTRYYLSAFLSAFRSITFALQAAMKDIPNFEEWYEQHQNALRQNDLAKYFIEARNLSQKVGYYPLTRGQTYHDENKKMQVEYFSTYFQMTSKPLFPKKMF
ncbi:hypothetical protein EZS27_002008 [termite gut metagenome]|uniref:Uncharacterized protein n=1 Tax=termite gut metagenome TaxID=433724 RepID=A0A5J4SYU2_9ZZZZ